MLLKKILSVFLIPLSSFAQTASVTKNSGQIPPASAIYAFTGTSINDDDHNVLGPAITVSSWTRSGSVVSFINTGTNGFAAGDWVNARFLTGWPAPPSGVALGTGYTLFRVLATGLSTTTLQINVGSLTPSNCSSSCGTISTAMYNLPFITTQNTSLPGAAASNTYMYIPAPVTIAGIASNYATIFHPLSPAQNGGRTGYLIINDHGNDDSTCIANATTWAAYQSVFSQAHADGWIVVVGTGITGLWNQFTSCATSYQLWVGNHQWLLYQGKSSSNIASGQYWDILDDTHAAIPDGSNGNLLNGTFGEPTAAGTKAMAALISGDIVAGAGTPIDYFPDSWGGYQSTVNAARGRIYQPSADGTFAWQWLSADGTAFLGAIDSISNRWYVANCLTVGFGSGSTACPSGYSVSVNGGVKADHIIDTSLGSGTSPVCPNGTNNELTNSGCTVPSAGTVTYTSSQTASTADNGKLVIFNSSSACVYTLPSTQPSTTWSVTVKSVGSTTCTIALGGGDTYNGIAAVPVLNKFAPLPIWANTATSTDYQGGTPIVAGSGVTNTPASNGQTLAATGGGGTTVSTFTCADVSGSNSAQVCAASPTLSSVSVNTSITYTTTTANTGTLTLNVSTLTSGAHVKKWGGSADLASGDMPANKSVTLNWDGTNWDAMDIGNAPSGGGGGVNGTPLRGSGLVIASSPGGTVVHTLPAGSAAGDFGLLVQGGANGASCPTGWTSISGAGAAFWQGRTCIEAGLTSGEITAGSISWGSGGASAAGCLAVFVGPTTGVREVIQSQNGSAQSGVMTAGGVDLSTDTLIHCNTFRSGGSGVFATLNRGMQDGYTYDGSIGNGQGWVEYLNYDSVQTMNWNWNVASQYYLATVVVAK